MFLCEASRIFPSLWYLKQRRGLWFEAVSPQKKIHDFVSFLCVLSARESVKLYRREFSGEALKHCDLLEPVSMFCVTDDQSAAICFQQLVPGFSFFFH